jgi:uncharacterized membrane protein
MSTRERGQATVLVVGLALVAFAVAGLAVDGSRAFLLRRSLQNSADAAAVAAASEVDPRSYYSSGGEVVELDADAALAEAKTLLRARGSTGRVGIDADQDGVTIVVRADLPTTFLGVVGIGSIPVAVEARARPIPGSPR